MPLEIDKAINKHLEDNTENSLEAGISNEGAQVEVKKTWKNGWGVAAYVKSKWSKNSTEAGAKVTKTWE